MTGSTAALRARSQVEYDLGPAQAIPVGEGRQFQVGELLIAVFRTRLGVVYATQARCPHQRGPLADGLVDEQLVVCPLHAFKFSLASGAAVGHACGALETYPVRLSPSGAILVSVPR